MSGIKAAHVLSQKGYRVSVLEACDYIGGRLKKFEWEGKTFEYGANFIHGKGISIFTTNPLVPHLKEEKMAHIPWAHTAPDGCPTWDENGNDITKEFVAEMKKGVSALMNTKMKEKKDQKGISVGEAMEKWGGYKCGSDKVS